MLGEKVKAARKEMELTQELFSKKLGITRGYLSDIERGKIKGTVALINKLSDVTGKTISYFIDDDFTVQKYEILDNTINMLRKSGDIQSDGTANSWAKEMLSKVLEKEIQLQIEREKNHEKNSNL